MADGARTTVAESARAYSRNGEHLGLANKLPDAPVPLHLLQAGAVSSG